MTDSSDTISQEDRKRQLVEYLIREVGQGISGRDGEDIIDLTPSRALFVGVLQPPRTADVAAPVGAVPPPDTALGLDFRVAPSAESVRLTIKPRFSVYYPVFPDFDNALYANQTVLDPNALSEDPLPAETEQLTASQEGSNPDPAADGDSISDDEPTAPSGRVTLSRVFRRHDINVDPFTIELGDKDNVRTLIGVAEISAAIAKAREAISSDAQLWRHLGSPEEASRELGDAATIATAKAYETALRTKGKTPVSLPPWSVAVQIDSSRDPTHPSAIRVQVLLSNTTSTDIPADVDRGLEERSLFDCQVSVEVERGVLFPFDFLLAPKDYRSKPEMVARGINSTAVCDSENPNRLATENLPVFRQPYYRTKPGDEVVFADLDVDGPQRMLASVSVAMDDYLKRWDQFLKNERPSKWGAAEVAACQADRDAFAREIEGFRLGLEALNRDPILCEAFRLMNRAFVKIGRASGGRLNAWRLFQIGFIVSQLPALAVRELDPADETSFANKLRELLNQVGVLWFPTGGGKTESYLGLLATALIYDRLRGKTRGVTAWMRFPLRMLSLQQLERLSKVIAALNELRAEYSRLAVGDPFAIGYFVGDSVTPNSVNARKMEEVERDAAARETLRLLRKCPFCGESVEIRPLRQQWRIAHVCSNAACFSNTSSVMGAYKGSLPLCITDNETYRYLPAVLVGTVDKLAIIPRSPYCAHIVRGATQQCPQHRYTSYDQCIEAGDWAAACKTKRKSFAALPPIKDPGPSLLIQDELHLLRAELGVFNGHYEGLLRYLGERAYMRPKVLAATATIEAYDVQTFHIYLADSCRYPQPSWQTGDTFYATSTPLIHRRFYVGILNHTRAVEDSALRVLSLYLRAIRRLRNDLPKLIEILGGNITTEDASAMLRLYDLSLCYVNRKATAGSLADKMQQIEQRVLGRESLGDIKHRILTGDQTTEVIGATLDAIEKEKEDTGEPRLDVVMATNLISHGVDLERINMMTICGMPSHYAEYVQSSSRAARSHPGIIFVCFKSRDPREHSQFEFFFEMHEHMERLIEAIAVNRFASFAPQKTVPGLLSGLLLCDYSPTLFGTAIAKTLDHIPTLRIALGLQPGTTSTTPGSISRDEIQTAIEKIIGVDKVYPPASPPQVDNVRARVSEVFDELIGQIGRTLETKLKDAINPLTSFRDVDEGVEFGSRDSSSLIPRLRSK
jgi:hypothetical protein